MTPHGKLTKWDELEIGERYERAGFDGITHIFTLTGVNRKQGWIVMNGLKVRAWRNRFVKVEKLLSEDSKSRIIGDNPTAAVREKMRWLDERDRLDRLSRNP